MRTSYLILIALSLSGLLAVSCEEDNAKTIGEIEVYDDQGRSVSNAQVRLYCTESNCVVEREGVTDSRGVYSEEFEKPVVLAVEAFKLDTTITDTGSPPNVGFIVEIDSAYGEGFISVGEGKTTSKPIVLLPR
ncbi:MAG: hypothetical protein ACFB10_17015 [Salibacteraceae bacterium]